MTDFSVQTYAKNEDDNMTNIRCLIRVNVFQALFLSWSFQAFVVGKNMKIQLIVMNCKNRNEALWHQNDCPNGVEVRSRLSFGPVLVGVAMLV